jgi:uncharacterized protein (TIGR02246 family)
MTRTSGVSLALCCAFVLSTGAGLFAQTSDDEIAIQRRMSEYTQAKARRDSKAESECFAEDGDVRTGTGPFITGRAAIERRLAVTDPNYQFQLEISSLRFIAGDVAIVEADLRAGVSAPLAKMSGTYIMVKRQGQWFIGAARIVPETTS